MNPVFERWCYGIYLQENILMTMGIYKILSMAQAFVRYPIPPTCSPLCIFFQMDSNASKTD